MENPLHNPYEQVAGTDLILRDRLAIDRTILANERTVLSYIRTSLALVLTGAGCLKFFDNLGADMTGLALIVLGCAMIGVGIIRSRAMARRIGAAGKGLQHEQQAARANAAG